MAVSGGPDVATNGLVLALDIANDRSFRGEPTTNYVANPEFTSTSNWLSATDGGGTFSVSNGFGKVTPPTTGTFSYVYQSITLAVPSNTKGTFSTFYKNDRVGTYGVRLVYFSGSTVLLSPQKNITLDGTGGLRRLEITGSSVTASTSVRLDLLTGTLYGLTNSDVEFTKVQFELKPYATPFVSGTRGTTVATGGGWADVSGNGNNGGLVNGPTYDSSNLGSLVFDGVDDTVNIANTSNTQFSHTSPWSIIITYKLISQNNSVPGIIRKGDAGAGGSGIIIFYFTGGGVWWKHFNSQTQFTTIDLGVTKQIAFTYGGSGNVNAYVNGVFATTVGTMSDTETSSALELGRADQYGNINIYQFLKYDRQLSANEILQNFNAQRSRFGL